MKTISRQVRVFNAYCDQGRLIVDVVGGSGNTVKEFLFPPSRMVVDQILGWLENETDLDLFWQEDRRDSPWILRPSVVDPAQPPAWDTAAARYLDGRRQGQFDICNGTGFSRPLPLPRRKKDQ